LAHCTFLIILTTTSAYIWILELTPVTKWVNWTKIGSNVGAKLGQILGQNGSIMGGETFQKHAQTQNPESLKSKLAEILLSYYGTHSSLRLIPKVSKSSPKPAKIAELSLRWLTRSGWPLKSTNWPETWRKLEKNKKNCEFFWFFLVFW
jgi:hypothetical protein